MSTGKFGFATGYYVLPGMKRTSLAAYKMPTTVLAGGEAVPFKLALYDVPTAMNSDGTPSQRSKYEFSCSFKAQNREILIGKEVEIEVAVPGQTPDPTSSSQTSKTGQPTGNEQADSAVEVSFDLTDGLQIAPCIDRLSNWVGKKLTVTTKAGTVHSGTLKGLWGIRLSVQSGTETLAFQLSDLSLVELE